MAFNAAVELLKESGKENILQETYTKCKDQCHLAKEDMINYVQEIYKPFTVLDEISKKISELLTPKETKAEVEIIYQSIEDLHAPLVQIIKEIGILLETIQHLEVIKL